jgi:4a-hydroxytetrahydrobiopterin dehydratase
MENLVSNQELPTRLANLPGKWNLIEDNTKLEQIFRFSDFESAANFVNKIFQVVAEESHHPDICISYNKVEITLWTHAVGGLSAKDFDMARRIDGLAQKPY